MLCTNCKKEPATCFYTQTINGKESSAALCAHCAKLAGLGATDFLSPLFPKSIVQKTEFGNAHKKCSLCGLTFADIQRLGKVGCPDCYQTFRDELSGIIRSIHGTAKHAGSCPEHTACDISAPSVQPSEEEKLRADLAIAIQSEKYEEAARIRDAIKALKGESR